MRTSESITKVAHALVQAQADLKAVTKDATNPHFKNCYATLDAIMDVVRPALAKHGLALVQGAVVPESDQGVLTGFSLETVLVHESGEWIATAVIIPIEKASAQGVGSGVTYGRRYGVSALLALSTDEDDDGESATRHPPAPAARPAAAPPPKGKAERVAPPVPGERMDGPAGFVMPFGKTKGQQLGTIPLDSLRGAVDWVAKNAPGKFGDFVAAATALLGPRPGAGDEERFPDEEADDDLPF